MKYFKGDTATLYCEFEKDGKKVVVEKPKVRILHEFDDKIYEDLSWQEMNPFSNGYIYAFDTNICENYGKYVIVYEGKYNGETLNIIDSFDLVLKNIEDTNTIEIYGIVNDINNSKLIKDVIIKIKDLEQDKLIYQTTTDIDGKWVAFLFPSDYEFVFEKDGYESRTVRVQIGDENQEIQFNTIGMEDIKDKELGNGLYKIEEEFTSKNNMGINGIKINIFKADDTNNCLISTITDKDGKWKAFLDDGTYIMKITLPSGVEKIFNMTVYNDGNNVIEEFKIKESSVIKEKTSNGNGTEEIVDYVLDAHGQGIKGISIKAYIWINNEYKYYCEDITAIDGQFELHLDKGKYKLVISGSGFKTQEQIIMI